MINEYSMIIELLIIVNYFLLKFLCPGTPLSTKPKTFLKGLDRIKELGLNGEEVQFGRYVFLEKEQSKEVKPIAENLELDLTIHGPYYINLNAKEPEKVEMSINRIKGSAHRGFLMGAKSVCFHPAYRFDNTRDEITKKVRQAMTQIEEYLIENNFTIDVRPESGGKHAQFGTLDELLDSCEGFKQIKPCIDFAHIMATSNATLNNYEAFCTMLETVKLRLGPGALKEMHIHAGTVAFNDKGEIKALNLDDPESQFNYRELLQALVDYQVEGWIVAETPSIEEGALLLKNTYKDLRNNQ